MQTQKYFYPLLGLFIALIVADITNASAEDAAYTIHLDRANSAQMVNLSGRYRGPANDVPALLRGSGSVFAKESTGTGTYYIKFKLEEPEKFQYHRSYVGLFVEDPNNPTSNGYYLFWEPSGIISLSKMTDGKMTQLNQFIRGGKDNPNRFEAEDVIELTLQIPAKGDGVWLWCRTADTKGEPTTGFKLSDDLPKKGHFGAYNAKWYSYMVVYELRYHPIAN